MPIYEFHCEKCGKDNEILVRSSDWRGTPCPACGSTKLEKKLSVFAASVAGNNSCAVADSCPSPMARSGGCGGCCGGGPHRH